MQTRAAGQVAITRLRNRLPTPFYEQELDENSARTVAGWWWTLREISQHTGDPEASISARLRDLRKARFGAHTVNRRRRGDPTKGVFEYQLL